MVEAALFLIGVGIAFVMPSASYAVTHSNMHPYFVCANKHAGRDTCAWKPRFVEEVTRLHAHYAGAIGACSCQRTLASVIRLMGPILMSWNIMCLPNTQLWERQSDG